MRFGLVWSVNDTEMFFFQNFGDISQLLRLLLWIIDQVKIVASNTQFWERIIMLSSIKIFVFFINVVMQY